MVNYPAELADRERGFRLDCCNRDNMAAVLRIAPRALAQPPTKRWTSPGPVKANVTASARAQRAVRERQEALAASRRRKTQHARRVRAATAEGMETVIRQPSLSFLASATTMHLSSGGRPSSAPALDHRLGSSLGDPSGDLPGNGLQPQQPHLSPPPGLRETDSLLARSQHSAVSAALSTRSVARPQLAPLVLGAEASAARATYESQLVELRRRRGHLARWGLQLQRTGGVDGDGGGAVAAAASVAASSSAATTAVSAAAAHDAAHARVAASPPPPVARREREAAREAGFRLDCVNRAASTIPPYHPALDAAMSKYLGGQARQKKKKKRRKEKKKE